MIVSLIFSLLAFFIVTTTTVIVIKNKSKVKNIDTLYKDTKLKFQSDKYSSEQKMNNLVNEINKNNKKLEHNHKVTKDELKKENKETERKVNNIDKRFNSYKNITTANFIGVNNRMTAENERLASDILINKEKIRKNRLEQQTINSRLSDDILENKTNFDNFRTGPYRSKMSNLDAKNDSMSREIYNFNSNLLGKMSVSNNMTITASQLLRGIVNTNHQRVSSGLNNFFNLPNNEETFLINSFGDVTGDNNFNNWFDNNYFPESKYQNFNNMESLLSNSDDVSSRLLNEEVNIFRLQQSNSEHEKKIKGIINDPNNLKKSNLYSYINNEYNFNLNSLSNISSNTDVITQMKIDFDLLKQNVTETGILSSSDLETDGRITLGSLFSRIESNTLSNDETKLYAKTYFDDNFVTNFSSNFDTTLETSFDRITNNLNQLGLSRKLNNQNLYLNDLNTSNLDTSNLDVTGEFTVKGMDVKTNIDKHGTYLNTLDEIFDYRGVVDNNIANSKIGSIDDDSGPLLKFKKNGELFYSSNDNGKNTQDDDGEHVEFKKGTDLILSRKNIGMKSGGSPIPEGGKIFVDSFYDIGISQYNRDNDRIGILNNTDSKNSRYTFGDSLGSKLEEIETKINTINTDKANGGVSKMNLFHILNPSTDDYSTTLTHPDEEEWFKKADYGKGQFGDVKRNSFRINDLYTGIPKTTTISGDIVHEMCIGTSGGLKQCQTIDDRLNTLETSSLNDDPSSQFNSDVRGFGLIKSADRGNNNLNMDFTNITTSSTLSVPTIITKNIDFEGVGGNNYNRNKINVRNGDINVEETGNIILKNVGQLKLDTTLASGRPSDIPLLDGYMKKADTNYIKNVRKDGNIIKFIKNDDTEHDTEIDTGVSGIQSERGDVKTIAKRDTLHGTFAGHGFTSGDINGYDVTNHPNPTGDINGYSINVPSKYVKSITASPGNINVETAYIGDTKQVLTSLIPTGISDRAGILNKLGQSAEIGEVVKPDFGKGIKFGSEGCIKMVDSKLFVCGSSDCDEPCFEVWDKKSAPEPS
jgi:hypothetical protein